MKGRGAFHRVPIISGLLLVNAPLSLRNPRIERACFSTVPGVCAKTAIEEFCG